MLTLLLYRCALPNSSTNLEVRAGKDFGGCEEAHLEVSVVVHFEELFEALLENWVSERVGHDVEAAGHFDAGLHLDDAHLVERRHEDIDNDARCLGSDGAVVVKLGRSLQVPGVLPFLLDVQVRSDFLGELLGYDLAWAGCYGTAQEVDDAGTTLAAASHFKKADRDVEGGADAAGGSAPLCCWPWIGLEIVQNRI